MSIDTFWSINVSNILNRYRENFAKFLEKNYDYWINSPYRVSRPLLNSDIPNILNLDSEDIYYYF